MGRNLIMRKNWRLSVMALQYCWDWEITRFGQLLDKWLVKQQCLCRTISWCLQHLTVFRIGTCTSSTGIHLILHMAGTSATLSITTSLLPRACASLRHLPCHCVANCRHACYWAAKCSTSYLVSEHVEYIPLILTLFHKKSTHQVPSTAAWTHLLFQDAPSS